MPPSGEETSSVPTQGRSVNWDGIGQLILIVSFLGAGFAVFSPNDTTNWIFAFWIVVLLFGATLIYGDSTGALDPSKKWVRYGCLALLVIGLIFATSANAFCASTGGTWSTSIGGGGGGALKVFQSCNTFNWSGWLAGLPFS